MLDRWLEDLARDEEEHEKLASLEDSFANLTTEELMTLAGLEKEALAPSTLQLPTPPPATQPGVPPIPGEPPMPPEEALPPEEMMPEEAGPETAGAAVAEEAAAPLAGGAPVTPGQVGAAVGSGVATVMEMMGALSAGAEQMAAEEAPPEPSPEEAAMMEEQAAQDQAAQMQPAAEQGAPPPPPPAPMQTPASNPAMGGAGGMSMPPGAGPAGAQMPGMGMGGPGMPGMGPKMGSAQRLREKLAASLGVGAPPVDPTVGADSVKTGSALPLEVYESAIVKTAQAEMEKEAGIEQILRTPWGHLSEARYAAEAGAKARAHLTAAAGRAGLAAPERAVAQTLERGGGLWSPYYGFTAEMHSGLPGQVVRGMEDAHWGIRHWGDEAARQARLAALKTGLGAGALGAGAGVAAGLPSGIPIGKAIAKEGSAEKTAWAWPAALGAAGGLAGGIGGTLGVQKFMKERKEGKIESALQQLPGPLGEFYATNPDRRDEVADFMSRMPAAAKKPLGTYANVQFAPISDEMLGHMEELQKSGHVPEVYATAMEKQARGGAVRGLAEALNPFSHLAKRREALELAGELRAAAEQAPSILRRGGTGSVLDAQLPGGATQSFTRPEWAKFMAEHSARAERGLAHASELEAEALRQGRIGGGMLAAAPLAVGGAGAGGGLLLSGMDAGPAQ